MKFISADLIYSGGEFRRDHVVLVDGQGRVSRVVHRRTLAQEREETASDLHHLPECAVLPGCVNSHSHSFQVLLRGRADQARDFEDWVDSHLYPLALAIDEEGIYSAALLAFHQMLLAGTTTVGEFFYLQNDARGRSTGNANSRAVIRAAREVGLRIALLRTFYDQGVKPGQARFKETADVARRHTEELAAACAGDPAVSVLPAPHSLHGASEAAIRAAVELAEAWECPFHIHLAERAADVERAKARFGCRPLEALERMGALGPRTVVVHGCWLDDGERARLAQAGGGLAYNPITNMYLGDGLTDLPDLVERGVPVSLGTDANTVLSVYAEMRAAEGLQRIRKGEMGVVARASRRPGTQALFEMGTSVGGRNLGIAAGRLEPGEWADMVALDLSDPSLSPSAEDGGRELLGQVVFGMVPETAVRHVFVGGVPVLFDRRPLRYDPEEVRDRIRRHPTPYGAPDRG